MTVKLYFIQMRYPGGEWITQEKGPFAGHYTALEEMSQFRNRLRISGIDQYEYRIIYTELPAEVAKETI